MNRWLFLLLLLSMTGFPVRLQAENVAVPLAAPGQQVQTAPAVNDELGEIEPPLPLPDQNWLLPAGGVALLVVSGGLLFFYLQRKHPKPQIPPLAHETALLQLSHAEKFIAAQNGAAFAALFDQTLRGYLEERFGITAPKQTASELSYLLTEDEAKLPELLRTHSENLQSWLHHFDLVKFANATLSQEQMTTLAAELRLFIEASKAEAVKKHG
jgi:hypothetical protein